MTRPQGTGRRVPRRARVLRTETLGPGLIRVVLGGDGLSGFAPEFADSYVKLIFGDPDGPDRRQRTYTVRAFDPAACELTLDVVVHGAEGLAGPWAAQASAGDEVLLQGPGGGYTPSTEAEWHLLAGDESALPAIAVALERLPPGSAAQAFIEVHGPEDELDLAASDAAVLTWLHRGASPVGERLVEAVRSWPIPPGTGHLFVHGEAGTVKSLRRYLRLERGLPMEQLSISGYWRLGVDDEGWRSVKRDWNRDIEQTERAGGVAGAGLS